MIDSIITSALNGLAVMLTMGVLGWLYSLLKNNVNAVDSLWSLMFLAAALVYAGPVDDPGAFKILLLVLIAIWALRLSLFLVLRNWGEPEDRRYQEIRENNQPHFKWKSIYIVFGLQAGLAWIISMPLLLALTSGNSIGVLEYLAAGVCLVGIAYEAVADYQLYRFKKNPSNKGKVLDSGLWAYSRHPNYFGEFMVWWGFYLFALSSGAWWTIFSPLIMTLLLLKVSGVSLMEQGISERRPNYRRYIESTNAFFPGKPGRHNVYLEGGQRS